MFVAKSQNRRARRTQPEIIQLLKEVSATNLREFVEMIAFPRHYFAEHRANVKARNLLQKKLVEFGYTPYLQGNYDNIIAMNELTSEPYLLLGAHYDSVPETPGADDNGSAVAVALECARLAKLYDVGPVMIVFFNREEDGLLGAMEFVEYLGKNKGMIAESHIFEMVGYCTNEPNSQRMPPGLPGVFAPSVGNFLGLLANRDSNKIAEQLLSTAATYLRDFPVLALKVMFGLEKRFSHLLRSDHAPFWEARIPSIMWTDTSEFRNANYHEVTDTPDTLDYEYMSNVAKLTMARMALWSGA